MKNNRHLPGLPVQLAALALLISVLLFMVNLRSPARQAREGLRELYTVSQDRDLSLFYNNDNNAVIEQNVHVRISQDAKKALTEKYIPISILFKGIRPVYEKAYPVKVSLEKVPVEKKAMKRYRYVVKERKYMPKDILEVLPQVEEVEYTGSIDIRRKGIGWEITAVSVD